MFVCVCLCTCVYAFMFGQHRSAGYYMRLHLNMTRRRSCVGALQMFVFLFFRVRVKCIDKCTQKLFTFVVD